MQQATKARLRSGRAAGVPGDVDDIGALLKGTLEGGEGPPAGKVTKSRPPSAALKKVASSKASTPYGRR